MYIVPTHNSLVARRFWEKVDIKGPDECWEWLGAKDKRSGYGRAGDGESTIYAHRLSWMLINGAIPKFIDHRKTMIRHLCHNPSCVNPKHLAIGNGSDNNRDSHKIGKGISFVPYEVRLIRKLKLLGMRNEDMARKFKVCHGTIDRVLRKEGIYSEY